MKTHEQNNMKRKKIKIKKKKYTQNQNLQMHKFHAHISCREISGNSEYRARIRVYAINAERAYTLKQNKEKNSNMIFFWCKIFQKHLHYYSLFSSVHVMCC